MLHSLYNHYSNHIVTTTAVVCRRGVVVLWQFSDSSPWWSYWWPWASLASRHAAVHQGRPGRRWAGGNGCFFFGGEKPREIQVEEMNTWKFVDMIWYNIWYNIWYMMFFPHHETKRSLGLEKEASVEFTDRTNACLWIYGARSSEDLRGPLRRFMAIEWGQWWTNRWNVMECFCSPSFSDNHDLHGGMMECFFPPSVFLFSDFTIFMGVGDSSTQVIVGVASGWRSTVVDPWGYNYEIIWIYNTNTLW